VHSELTQHTLTAQTQESVSRLYGDYAGRQTRVWVDPAHTPLLRLTAAVSTPLLRPYAAPRSRSPRRTVDHRRPSLETLRRSCRIHSLSALEHVYISTSTAVQSPHRQYTSPPAAITADIDTQAMTPTPSPRAPLQRKLQPCWSMVAGTTSSLQSRRHARDTAATPALHQRRHAERYVLAVRACIGDPRRSERHVHHV